MSASAAVTMRVTAVVRSISSWRDLGTRPLRTLRPDDGHSSRSECTSGGRDRLRDHFVCLTCGCVILECECVARSIPHLDSEESALDSQERNSGQLDGCWSSHVGRALARCVIDPAQEQALGSDREGNRPFGRCPFGRKRCIEDPVAGDHALRGREHCAIGPLSHGPARRRCVLLFLRSHRCQRCSHRSNGATKPTCHASPIHAGSTSVAASRRFRVITSQNPRPLWEGPPDLAHDRAKGPRDNAWHRPYQSLRLKIAGNSLDRPRRPCSIKASLARGACHSARALPVARRFHLPGRHRVQIRVRVRIEAVDGSPAHWRMSSSARALSPSIRACSTWALCWIRRDGAMPRVVPAATIAPGRESHQTRWVSVRGVPPPHAMVAMARSAAASTGLITGRTVANTNRRGTTVAVARLGGRSRVMPRSPWQPRGFQPRPAWPYHHPGS